MAQNSAIQWTDNTVNFWTGCTKVSSGCKYCYMYRGKERYGKDPSVVMRTKSSTFNAALKWKEPKKIFTCSWSDFFIKDADLLRADAWDIIKRTPHHTWQILTKRPERIAQCLPADWGEGYKNVWLGVSVEEQSYLHRVDTLLSVPAKTRFISAEPLIGPVNFNQYKLGILKDIDWVIVGGESGNDNGQYRYRPCSQVWIEDIVNECQVANVAVFVKQVGTHLAKANGYKDRHGGDISEWTSTIQVRQFP